MVDAYEIYLLEKGSIIQPIVNNRTWYLKSGYNGYSIKLMNPAQNNFFQKQVYKICTYEHMGNNFLPVNLA